MKSLVAFIALLTLASGLAWATLSPETMSLTDLSYAGIYYPANSGNFVNMRTALMNPPWPVTIGTTAFNNPIINGGTFSGGVWSGGNFFANVNNTPVARSVMGLQWNTESSPDYPLKSEAGIWPTDTYSFFGVSKEFTSSTLPATGAGSPSVGLFSFVNNNGSDADVTATIGDAVARQNSSVVFGSNFIARSGGGGLTNVKLVGQELDIEPANADTVGSGGGLFINAFNVAMPIPGIQLGSVGGGTFANGIVINGVSGAGLVAGSGSTMASFINTSVAASFTSDAIVLGNNQAVQWLGTSSNARARVDTSNNWDLVAPSGIFLEPVGNIAVRATNPSSAVNYLSLSGSATTTPVTIQAAGSDTNIGVNIAGGGAGAVDLISNGNPALIAANVASPVNYVDVFGSATGTPVTVEAGGSDTNLGLNLASKGTGAVALIANGVDALTVANASASDVNYINVTGATTGNAASVSSVGSDTNISLNLVAKGTGLIQLFSNGSQVITGTNASASDVNYVNVTGSTTGNPPTIASTGSDSAVGLNINTKSTGPIQLFEGGTHIATVNTHLEVLGSSPTIGANACGSSTQGTVVGTDNGMLVTAGTSSVTSCAVSFAHTWSAAPQACTFSPANATGAGSGVAAYVSAISATGFTITGTALASAAFYVHCL